MPFGFETQDPTLEGLLPGSSGAFDNAVAHGAGLWSYRCAPGVYGKWATAGNYSPTSPGAVYIEGLRASAYLYIIGPPSSVEEVVHIDSVAAGPVNLLAAQVTPGMALQIAAPSGTVLWTSGVEFSAGEWHHLHLVASWNPAERVWVATVWLDYDRFIEGAPPPPGGYYALDQIAKQPYTATEPELLDEGAERTSIGALTGDQTVWVDDYTGSYGEEMQILPVVGSYGSSWTDNAGGLADLWDAVNDLPPVGHAVGAGGPADKIQNPTPSTLILYFLTDPWEDWIPPDRNVVSMLPILVHSTAGGAAVRGECRAAQNPIGRLFQFWFGASTLLGTASDQFLPATGPPAGTYPDGWRLLATGAGARTNDAGYTLYREKPCVIELRQADQVPGVPLAAVVGLFVTTNPLLAVVPAPDTPGLPETTPGLPGASPTPPDPPPPDTGESLVIDEWDTFFRAFWRSRQVTAPGTYDYIDLGGQSVYTKPVATVLLWVKVDSSVWVESGAWRVRWLSNGIPVRDSTGALATATDPDTELYLGARQVDTWGSIQAVLELSDGTSRVLAQFYGRTIAFKVARDSAELPPGGGLLPPDPIVFPPPEEFPDDDIGPGDTPGTAEVVQGWHGAVNLKGTW